MTYLIIINEHKMLNNKKFEDGIKMEYKIGFEKGPISPNAHVCENIETEVDSSDIDLKSFELQDELADIWESDGSLNLRVRDRLLDIADDFWETVGVSWVKPENILLVGSICNYNWSIFSDIDLHLVVDFSKIHKNMDFVQDYFNEKKTDWNNTHEGLEIMGFPIEIYVQDINAKTDSDAEYDLEDNNWIKKPNHKDFKPIDSNSKRIKVISAKLITKIDDMSSEFKNESDLHKVEVLGKKVDKLLNKIMSFRKDSLKDGEMSVGNICYKVLRRSEYLDRLWDLKNKIYDKVNSI